MMLPCLLSMTASGQSVRRDTVTDRTHQLREVTVTESRRQQEVTSTAPLHIINREQMLSLGVTDVADALHRIPGVTLRDYGGAGGLKTVSVRGFGAKHTGVSYDGVMLSDCQSGEIDLSRYSLDNVDQLSLVIGDNDDIFIPARNASAPAILNIQTIGMPSADKHPHCQRQTCNLSCWGVCLCGERLSLRTEDEWHDSQRSPYQQPDEQRAWRVELRVVCRYFQSPERQGLLLRQ